MKKVFFILPSSPFSCFNADGITPIDDTEKEVVLNLEWESETAPFLPQGLVYDIFDKQNPNEIGCYINDTAQENTPKAYNNIILDGNYVYVTVDYCGFEVGH